MAVLLHKANGPFLTRRELLTSTHAWHKVEATVRRRKSNTENGNKGDIRLVDVHYVTGPYMEEARNGHRKDFSRALRVGIAEHLGCEESLVAVPKEAFDG